MSVPAPTTSDVLLGRYQEGVDYLVFDLLSPSQLNELENTSWAVKRHVQGYYRSKYPNIPDLMDAFEASQGETSEEKKCTLKEKAVALIAKSKRLHGGEFVLHKATNYRSANIFHQRSQTRIAAFRWNCKVIGLLPFLQKIDAARQMLKGVRGIESDCQKFKVMQEWMLRNPQHVKSLVDLRVDAYHPKNLKKVTQPKQESKRILIYLPDEVGCFTELKTLSLNFNGLTELPDALGKTKVETLEVRGNFFKEMPTAIPTLRSLYLTQNFHEFTAEKVDAFIRQFLVNGGQSIRVFLDEEYHEKFKEKKFISEIGTHEVNIELQNGETILTVSKILESLTQPLTQPSELP